MNYDKLPKRIANWLKKNREKFGTKDGLPGFYHRRDLFRAIHPGSKVMVQNCHGGASCSQFAGGSRTNPAATTGDHADAARQSKPILPCFGHWIRTHEFLL